MTGDYDAQVRKQLADARTARAAAEQRANTAEAALAQLHAGEEPYEDERLFPTPAQWIWRWNRATPAERLEIAANRLDLLERANRCVNGMHEQRLAERWDDLMAERQRSELAESQIAAVRALAAKLRATHAVGGRWDGLQEAADDIDELLDAAPSADPALVTAEDALTRVIRLAATLPPTVRTQIEQAIDGTAGQPSVVPCPGRPGFCRPCRTIHRAASSTAPASEQGAHDYLSTGCLHGEHAYCQGHTGAAGAKIPAQCKFCAAPCCCNCHAVADGPS